MNDRPDFEAMLERRLRAHAATAVRPVPALEIVRSTMWAAATPVVRTSAGAGPRRPALMVGLAAVLLLAAVAGAALIGGRPAPIQGVFVDGPSLVDRQIRSAIALPDGRVLLGVDSDKSVIPGTTTLQCAAPCGPHLMLLDPRTGTFTQSAPPPPSFAVESMALLQDGRVLIVNGARQGLNTPSAAIYDPVADRFDAVGAPRRARMQPLLVTLADGRVLVCGGDGGAPLATAELFDPRTGTFSRTGSMDRPRSGGMIATLLADGRVLVVGSVMEVGTSAELYDPVIGTFTRTGPMTAARGGFFTATLLPDGRVLVAGGLISAPAQLPTVPDGTAAAEVYDPATGTFSAVEPMAAPRFMHAASILPDGTVLIAGGVHELPPSRLPAVASDAEIFDPATGTFRATGSLVRPRVSPIALSVDERVLVLGSLDVFGNDPDTSASTEWFQ